jgi:glucose uptake protein GlcU
MKLLITILMLITVVSAGLASLYFFRDFNYNLSSLLDIIAYAAIVIGIYLMTVNNRKTLSHQE